MNAATGCRAEVKCRKRK